MVDSKAWDWKEEASLIWKRPCEESYYYSEKWKSEDRKKILDLGCGLGRHSILFASEGFEVTAVDLSKDAIESTIGWQKRLDLSFPVVQMDMQELNFEDNTFDCIWSYMVISHTDTEGFVKLVKKLEDILKPGGEIFITVCSKDAAIFKKGGEKRIDSNTIIKSNEGSEKDIPHFYVDLDDIQNIFKNFKLNRIRHIDNCCFDGKIAENKHYYIEAVLR